MYKILGGLGWVKANFRVINCSKSLDEIMAFGDKWRELGYAPVVHIPGAAVPGWDKPWKSPVHDPSGLTDNIPAHVDLFVFDPYNEEHPSGVLPDWSDSGGNPWVLWERANRDVYFNGTKSQFEAYFAHELRDYVPGAPPVIPPVNPGDPPEDPPVVFGVGKYKITAIVTVEEVE